MNDKPILRITVNGIKRWELLDGRFHREDGPAFDAPNDFKSWWQYNERHREDGPAIEWADGGKEWWYRGKKIDCTTQEEFERLVRLKAFW